MNAVLKSFGTLLLIIGLIQTYKPNFLFKIPLPENAYDMIEVRVRWGFVIGLGILMVFLNPFDNYKAILYGLLFSLTLGIIISRLSGLVLDGFFIKQILWLSIEILIALLFGYLYWKQGSAL